MSLDDIVSATFFLSSELNGTILTWFMLWLVPPPPILTALVVIWALDLLLIIKEVSEIIKTFSYSGIEEVVLGRTKS